jgi:hypothetical protein
MPPDPNFDAKEEGEVVDEDLVRQETPKEG